MAEISESTFRPHITAHRGASAEYPENTIAAFEAGLRVGADASECDVHRSSDGKLVVIHDDTVDRTTNGTGPVSEMTADDLLALDAGGCMDEPFSGERLPLLEDVIEIHKGRAQLIIEIKDYECTPDVLDCVGDLDAHQDVSICSFSYDECVRSRNRSPEIPVAFIYSGADEHLDCRALVDRVLRGNIGVLSLHHALVDRDLVNVCRSRGITLWAWTVDTPERVRDLAVAGVQNIVSNRPAMALGVVESLSVI